MDLEKLSLPLEVADKAFNIGVAAAAAAVTALAAAMSLAVKSTFTWAEQLDSIQDVIGGTNENAAALNFILRKSGVATDSFNKAMIIMSKGLVKADGTLDTVGQGFKNWGIDVRDSNGVLKTQTQLIEDASAKYNTFATQQEKVNFLTEVFGRGGAEMVDFFDVLAKEGSIDAVTQKVKDMGLVIDPARYENFTRSLEEIKLAGLGLAVGFTEALMPAFESVLMWAQQFQGMSPDQIFQRLAEQASTLPAMFGEWAKSVNWEQVSADLIAGIDSIDWNGIGMWVGESAKVIADGLINIFSGVDWGGLFSSIGTAFMEFSTGLVGGDFATFKSVWQDNWNQAGLIVVTAIDGAKAAITGWLKSIPASIKLYFAQAVTALVEWVAKFMAALAPMLNVVASIGGVVNNALGVGSGGSTGGGNHNPARASGGYASGQTLVGENGPELVNLPSGAYVNNNLSSQAMSNQPVQAFIDYDELARTLARVLGQTMQRGY